MSPVTAASWQLLPARATVYAELAAEPVVALDGAFLAVDHEASRHLLLAVSPDIESFSDDRSRGIRALTRPLAVQGQPERSFIDVVCTSLSGHEVFNLVVTAILGQLEQGMNAQEAVRSTLGNWRRFWGAIPPGGLTDEEIRGIFGELWFLAVWLLPHGHDHVAHWLGPTGSRHDFVWQGLAVEAKTTTSVRGHLHRINGIDQLESPPAARLQLFSLRMREEASASNTLPALIATIMDELEHDSHALDTFEVRLSQSGYSTLDADRYGELRFRVVSERLYDVRPGFPLLSPASFPAGVPDGIERVEYEINLDAAPGFIVSASPADFDPPLLARRVEGGRDD